MLECWLSGGTTRHVSHAIFHRKTKWIHAHGAGFVSQTSRNMRFPLCHTVISSLFFFFFIPLRLLFGAKWVMRCYATSEWYQRKTENPLTVDYGADVDDDSANVFASLSVISLPFDRIKHAMKCARFNDGPLEEATAISSHRSTNTLSRTHAYSEAFARIISTYINEYFYQYGTISSPLPVSKEIGCGRRCE